MLILRQLNYYVLCEPLEAALIKLCTIIWTSDTCATCSIAQHADMILVNQLKDPWRPLLDLRSITI